MHLSRITHPLALLLVLSAGAATAATHLDDLRQCTQIAHDAARLACYDTLAAALQPAAPAPAPDADVPVSAAPAPAAAAPSPGATPATAAPTESAIDRFGAESLARPNPAGNSPEQIQSRISGPFKGWDGKTLFKLDNGQVWRCVQCDEVYHVADSPTVTIKRNFLGNYWLSVEGLNRQARVKRVQ